MRKKIVNSIALFLGVVFLAGMPVYAAADEAGNVFDDASLLTEAEIVTLSDEISTLETKTGWDIFVVSTADAEGKSTIAYADDFFDMRTEENASGVVLIIDMDNREVYISTGGAAIRYLTDSRLDAILDDCYDEVLEEDYFGCFETMLYDVEYYYDKGIQEGQYNYDVETGEVSRYHGLSLMEVATALIAAIVAGAAFFVITVGKYRLKFNTDKYDFHKYGRVHITNSQDQLVNVTHSQHRIQSSSGGGGSHGSSGRSSTHRSSSGRSHGGRGRSF